MDFKDPKTQKLLLVALVFVLALYFWHSKVYEPASEQLSAQRASYEQVMTNLKTIELKAKSLTGLRKEYDKLLDRYQSIEQLLPEEEQVPDFLMQLHSASMISQAKIGEVMPQMAGSESFYNTSEYGVKFVGTYHELGRFLAAVANFPFITNVSRLNLKGLPPEVALQKTTDRKKGDYDSRTLEANFFLSTYFVKPEEKLKGVQFEGEETENAN
ncbi:MAG: type 4a pilus biogenesis protein PilO [Candidatus Zixiibacteriota bacterium]